MGEIVHSASKPSHIQAEAMYLTYEEVLLVTQKNNNK